MRACARRPADEPTSAATSGDCNPSPSRVQLRHGRRHPSARPWWPRHRPGPAPGSMREFLRYQFQSDRRHPGERQPPARRAADHRARIEVRCGDDRARGRLGAGHQRRGNGVRRGHPEGRVGCASDHHRHSGGVAGWRRCPGRDHAAVRSDIHATGHHHGDAADPRPDRAAGALYLRRRRVGRVGGGAEDGHQGHRLRDQPLHRVRVRRPRRQGAREVRQVDDGQGRRPDQLRSQRRPAEGAPTPAARSGVRRPERHGGRHQGNRPVREGRGSAAGGQRGYLMRRSQGGHRHPAGPRAPTSVAWNAAKRRRKPEYARTP